MSRAEFYREAQHMPLSYRAGMATLALLSAAAGAAGGWVSIANALLWPLWPASGLMLALAPLFLWSAGPLVVLVHADRVRIRGVPWAPHRTMALDDVLWVRRERSLRVSWFDLHLGKCRWSPFERQVAFSARIVGSLSDAMLDMDGIVLRLTNGAQVFVESARPDELLLALTARGIATYRDYALAAASPAAERLSLH